MLDLADSACTRLKYQNVEVPIELFIPVRSATQKEPGKDLILLATREPEFMKTVREMESVPAEEFKDWLAKNADRVFVRRDIKGLVQFGAEADSKTRRKLARIQDNLAPDFIILAEDKKPEFAHSVGYLALGAVMVVVSVVFVRRSRDPAPAETY